MGLIQWFREKFFTRNNQRRKASVFPTHQQITIDGSGKTLTFVFGTTAYAKGCEPQGGHKIDITIEHLDERK